MNEFHSEPNFNKLTPQKKNVPQDSEAPYHASHTKSTTKSWGIRLCCHCTPKVAQTCLLMVLTPCRHSSVQW